MPARHDTPATPLPGADVRAKPVRMAGLPVKLGR